MRYPLLYARDTYRQIGLIREIDKGRKEMNENRNLDEPELIELMEQSKDIHSDAMRRTRGDINDLINNVAPATERPKERKEEAAEFTKKRSEILGAASNGLGILGVTGLGAAMLALFSKPAFASSNTDIQILQTAASIENLAVATYQTALTLPFIGGSNANPVVKAFAQTTMKQHQEHAQAFNAAITALGGKQQNNPDPVLLKVVESAKPSLTSPSQVVNLALELEQGAAETYVANVAALSEARAIDVTSSIMGVEAQHVAILTAVSALLSAGAPQLITLPPPAAQLPAAAGSIGFPNAFYPTNKARPQTEGAVK
jgi:rubrerythrin